MSLPGSTSGLTVTRQAKSLTLFFKAASLNAKGIQAYDSTELSNTPIPWATKIKNEASFKARPQR